MDVQLLNDERMVARNTAGTMNASTDSARSSSDPSEPSCPIERLPFELLSQIFELCGREDWTGSLMISWVSGRWREIILATPLAWCRLKARSQYPKYPMGKHYRHSHLTAQMPVHMVLGPSIVPPAMFSSVTDNLHCLSLGSLHENLNGLIFPRLVRLHVDSYIGPSITNFRFPMLRHLWCRPVFSEETNNFPPLETLAFSITPSFLWIQPLEACAETLVSLKITVLEDGYRSPEGKIVFPRLVCLHIVRWDRQNWTLHFETPCLETYIETRIRRYGQHLLHDDLNNVTHARFNDVVPVPLLPRLRLLQLVTSGEDLFRRMIEAYFRNSTYPALNQVEVRFTTPVSDDKASEIMQEMTLPIPILISNHSGPLPGSLIMMGGEILCDNPVMH